MLSPGGAIIANKYMCLKGVRKKIWNLGSDPGPIRKFFGEEICGSDPDRTRIGPQIFQKKYSLCVQRWGGLESRAPGGYTWNLILFHMVKLIRSYIK